MLTNCKIIVASSILFAISFGFAPPCNADDKRDYEEALRLRDLGHNAEAARLLREVQRHRPNDAVVLTELGSAYMDNYNDISAGAEKAEKCFLRAIQLDPNLGKAYAQLSRIYNARGDFDKGIKMSTKAISVKQPEWEGMRERAAALSNLKRDKEALVDIELFIKKVQPPGRKVLVLRATILENLKDYSRALTAYRELLKEHYEDSIVYREFNCLRAMNKPDEALKSINKLLAHNSMDDIAFLNRARLFESMGKHKEAISDYGKTFELQPSTSVLKERASVYEKMGRKDLALKDRREADQLLRSENY